MEQLIPKDVRAALKLIELETLRARAKYPPIGGVHDGYGRLLEDVDGLFSAVKARPRSWTDLRTEAVRIAALMVSFIIDVTDVDDERFNKALVDAGLEPE